MFRRLLYGDAYLANNPDVQVHGIKAISDSGSSEIPVRTQEDLWWRERVRVC